MFDKEGQPLPIESRVNSTESAMGAGRQKASSTNSLNSVRSDSSGSEDEHMHTPTLQVLLEEIDFNNADAVKDAATKAAFYCAKRGYAEALEFLLNRHPLTDAQIKFLLSDRKSVV